MADFEIQSVTFPPPHDEENAHTEKGRTLFMVNIAKIV